MEKPRNEAGFEQKNPNGNEPHARAPSSVCHTHVAGKLVCEEHLGAVEDAVADDAAVLTEEELPDGGARLVGGEVDVIHTQTPLGSRHHLVVVGT